MTFNALRTALADEVTTAGLYTYPYEPQALSAPAGLVMPGFPYLEHGGHLGGDVRVRFYLYLIVQDESDEELDDLISKVYTALFRDYDIERIEIAPQLDGGVVSGARITLSTEVDGMEITN